MPVAASLTTLTPYLATAGIGWVSYRRIRRSFGRQPWQPARNAVRVVLMLLLLALLMSGFWFLPNVRPAVGIGLVAGAALGAFALRHTRFEWYEGRPTYMPNPWIGAALTLLLVGRLAQGAFVAGAAASAQQAGALTMGIAGTLVAYFLLLNLGLWLRMRCLQSEHAALD